MSYRTFKRVLGETSLERKCRWWFGISLGVLLFLSFSWYGKRTDQLVYESRRVLGHGLVTNALFQSHLTMFAESLPVQEPIKTTSPQPLVESNTLLENEAFEESNNDLKDLFTDLTASFKTTEYKWHAIMPQNSQKISEPGDEKEWALLTEWNAIKPEELQTKIRLKHLRADRAIEIDGERRYLYYEPIYATTNCVVCHRNAGKVPNSNLQVGGLIAIMKIDISDKATADSQAENYALLWTAAIVTGILSMIVLYVVVRYVIVKPVTHLRDVANSVRRGNTDQRARIKTGDEFEELASAFNRMVRQLLSQQDQLRTINSELDEKLDELAQANLRLFEMNQLKSDFLATMSHELRTPLNSILGFSDVLSGIESLDKKQLRYVENIQRSGSMLLEMINDILDLAKIDSGKMDLRLSRFSIETIISSQCDMARPLSEKKNIDLQIAITPNIPTLYQDQVKLQQILTNLLSNAIKFTPEGGRILISAEETETKQLRLIVTDTGIGIRQDEQQLVFEKFRQGIGALAGGDAMTREHSGTGLGLSIVRELCTLLGGEVLLESELGKGTTFTVILPWKLAEKPGRLDPDLQEGLAALTRQGRRDAILTTVETESDSVTPPQEKLSLENKSNPNDSN